MIFPCPNKVSCPDGDGNPLTNFSSEDPDPPLFIGYSTGTAPTQSFNGSEGNPNPNPGDGSLPGPGGSAGPGTGGEPPPLGGTYDNPDTTVFVDSTVSQPDANDAAGNKNVTSLPGNSNPGDGGWLVPPHGGGHHPPVPPKIFGNTEQTCRAFCPDGLPFDFTVAAGALVGWSRAQANAAARSVACRKAELERVCLSDLDPIACIGEEYLGVVSVDAVGLPVSFAIVSGALPGWASINTGGEGFTISGTPAVSDVGISHFTIRATDDLGNYIQKTFSLEVMGITNGSALPAFAKNAPYSFTFTAAGGTGGYHYALVTGPMPPGLSLSAAGTISGTPTVDSAAYPITVSVTDSAGHKCVDHFNFSNVCVPTITPALVANYAVAASQSVFSTKTGTLFVVDASDYKTILEINPSTGVVLNAFSIGADTVSSLFYENTHQRVYVGYNVGLLKRVAAIDPVTRTIVNSTTLTVSTGTSIANPRYLAYDSLRDKLWVSDGGNIIFAISCSSFAYSYIDFFFNVADFDPTNGICYCSVSDVVLVAGSRPSLANKQAVCAINPGSLAYTVKALSIAWYGEDMVYCPDNDRAYLAYNNAILKINPAAPLAYESIPVTGEVMGITYNPCTSRVEGFTFTPVTAWFIKRSDNSVVASVATGLPLSSFEPVGAWYDASNARVWVATGDRLLKFN